MSKTVDLISWNVNGVRSAEKKGFIEYVKNSGAAAVAIQETKAGPDQLSEALRNIPGYSSYWCSAQKKGYSGVALFLKEKPLSVIRGIGVAAFDDEGRVITAEYKDYFLIGAYYPNAQEELARLDYKLAFNRAILAFCDKLRKKKGVIICGDFNVAHQAVDLKNPKANEGNAGFSPPERRAMDKFIAAGYVDTFRMFNKEPGQYTWWSYRFKAREKNVGWRIDYFCVDEKTAPRLKGAYIFSDVMGSDHCPVGITLAM